MEFEWDEAKGEANEAKHGVSLEDDLRPEYNLKQLRVRRMGPGRERCGEVVRLAPDVARVFPDADAVNEALRFLVRTAQKHGYVIPKPKDAA